MRTARIHYVGIALAISLFGFGPLPTSTATHVCDELYSGGGFGGAIVTCSYTCPAGTYISVWVAADDPSASVFGETACNTRTESCSATRECYEQNPSPTPNSIGSGSCYGESWEVITDGLFVQCAASEDQWSFNANAPKIIVSVLTIKVERGLPVAEVCDREPSGHFVCHAVAASCVDLHDIKPGRTRCGVF